MRRQKSPTSTTPKDDDPLENDLLQTIGSQLSESARVIFNIKQSLYDLMKINVSASVPVRKYDTAPAIVAGSKRNLDDLRRVESMLKGYINTVRLESDNSSEDVGLSQNAMAKSATPFTTTNPINLQKQTKNNTTEIQTINKTEQANLLFTDLSQNTNEENIFNISEIREKGREKGREREREKGNLSGHGRGEGREDGRETAEVRGLREENQELRKYIDNLRSSLQSGHGNGRVDQQTREQLNKQPNLHLQLAQKQPQTQQTKQEQPKIGQKQNQNQKQKEKKLKNCKSAIFTASRNLQDIRSRNKQCLELIRTIRREIGLEYGRGLE